MCLSKDVTGTLRNYYSIICYLLLHRVSVQRRDRCTVIVILCEFLHSHSVSVQRRERSLFFLLHCSTKVLFYRLAWIRLVIFDLFLDFFSRFFIQCVCPKTWQALCFLFYLTQDLLLHSSAFLLVSQCVCPKT